MKKIYEYLANQIKKDGAVMLTLIDPDAQSPERAGKIAKIVEKNGCDGVMVGGTGGDRSMLDNCIREIKRNCKLPVIIFPGNVNDVSAEADAIFFMSLMNSRSRYWLSQAQALAAYGVREAKLEPIAMAYLIVESGVRTSVEFFGDANPIPRNKPKIAAAFALAAEYMGMKLVYLEGGSGAENAVPDDMIKVTKHLVSIPIIVGGGIKDAETAYSKVKSGADIVVIGTAIEKALDPDKKAKEIIDAVKKAGKEKVK